MCFWLSPALGDSKFTLPGPVDDCVAFARESRTAFKSGEVREEGLGEAVAEAEVTRIDGEFVASDRWPDRIALEETGLPFCNR